MTFIGWLQILIFSVVILALTKPIGVYMFRIFEGRPAASASLLRSDRAAVVQALWR